MSITRARRWLLAGGTAVLLFLLTTAVALADNIGGQFP